MIPHQIVLLGVFSEILAGGKGFPTKLFAEMMN